MSSTEKSIGQRSQEISLTTSQRIARSIVLKRLVRLSDGQLNLVDEFGQQTFGKEGDLRAEIRVVHRDFYKAVVSGGSIGAAEAFMLGYWTCDDLTEVVRLLVRNRDALDDVDAGTARLTALLRSSFRWLRRNTRGGSRRNIAAHYDLGNDFFSLWLDETMMYSSAVFERPTMSLHEASVAKLDRICKKLDLSENDHVLEIGTGWGGFAVHAAEHYGCHVTTTTISKEQHARATKRVNDLGLEHKITLLLNDYRDLEGQFDKLVSIEMIEAVGHEFMPTYFAKCSSLLRPDGIMFLQAITIQDQRYESALRTVDFIKRYIFPGGFLPSVTAMLDAATQATDMRIFHLEDIGPHYAKTLSHWRAAFRENIDAIRRQGYSEDFLRMWSYYFAYCEGAFIERVIGNAQILLVKPANRRNPIVPRLIEPAVGV